MNSQIQDFLRAPYEGSMCENERASTPPFAVADKLAMHLLFTIGNSTFALPADAIYTIEPLRTPAAVPFVRNSLCQGFLAIGGRAVPVVDIAGFVNVSRAPSVDRVERVVVLTSAHGLTALIPDKIIGVHGTRPAYGTPPLIPMAETSALLLSPDGIAAALQEGIL